PHRGSAEAFGEKHDGVGLIMGALGEHVGREPDTGFDLVKRPDGRVLKVADLVDDGDGRDGIKAALQAETKGPDGKRDDDADRAKVDIIIALGMAKEGGARYFQLRLLLENNMLSDERNRHGSCL
ncbi:MAG: hypothetical protein AAFO98_11570, partial [Pseudomonadota bacterium]